ncbi:DUF357 domain-containing protein [Candidatus Woesearchaeota archaeon]|nr:DUF357 domain-containing protein [Candidatus Woesearchaeota archaeon]
MTGNVSPSGCISSEKLAHYFAVTGKALKKVKLVALQHVPAGAAADFFDMASRYYQDAHFFEKKGDWVNAFACLNYAHGWLDAGARLGLFDVGGDSTLFTVDEKHDKRSPQ